MTIFAAAPARAAGGDDEESGPGRVAVAVFLLYEKELGRAAQANLTRGLEKALKKNERLAVKDKDTLLAEFAGEVPNDQISDARALKEAGEALLGQDKPKDAIDKLSDAENALEKQIAFIKKNELADAQFLLGVAYLQAGEKRKARAAFVRLQVWRPGYALDVERYPAVIPLWEEARAEIEKDGRGSLEILSEPEGAMAFVDGKYLGVTPTAADGLPVGHHYVTLKLEGYQRRVVKARVDSKAQELVTESLPKSEKYLLVEQSLARARDGLGEDKADQSMLDLRTFLFIDQAVFVRVTSDGKKVALDAHVYDLRSKKRLSSVTGVKVVPDGGDDMDKKLEQAARSMYAKVSYEGKPDAPVVRKPKKKGSSPFYTKWWFWTGVAVVGVAVASPFVYDGLAGPSLPDCPDGFTCGEVLFRW
jgi:tetratricopeptide (TPR) repeat protein